MDPLHLDPSHDEAIRQHGREAFPEECCGFLFGRDGGGRHIVTVVRETNVREDGSRHNRFSISPEGFIRADREARGAGLDIVGFYHTHPNAPARPSQYDLDHAWPVYSYVILSVQEGKPAAMTSWVLQEDRTGFAEQPIVLVSAAR